MSPASQGVLRQNSNGLIRAIVETLAYSDVFDYPLTIEELHRYLHGIETTEQEIHKAIYRGKLIPDLLFEENGFFSLAGKQVNIHLRKARFEVAEKLWAKARYYANLISSMPFVRMVAVTGSLAMDNEQGKDIDLLIVTEPGRLWLCRGWVVFLVRWASLRGDLVCPNYFLSEEALDFKERDLYAAHELTQMVPLSGYEVYEKIRKANSWVVEYLPNAIGSPKPGFQTKEHRRSSIFRKLLEEALRTRFGSWIEDWEMNRKIQKFRRVYPPSLEAAFSPDYCKGHFGEYGRATMGYYAERLKKIYE